MVNTVVDEVQQRTKAQARGITLTVLSIFFIVSLFMGLFLHRLLTPRLLSHSELLANGAVVFDVPRQISDFQLLDQNAALYTQEQLKGHWTLVFPGFTQCPDICPMTLASLNSVWHNQGDSFGDQTRLILLSVDPARDTPEKLKAYLNHFNRNFIGLTGDFLEIMGLTQSLNIAFNKVVKGEGYTVDHTANLIVINPNGHYHGFIKPPFEQAKMKLLLGSIQQSLVFQ